MHLKPGQRFKATIDLFVPSVTDPMYYLFCQYSCGSNQLGIHFQVRAPQGTEPKIRAFDAEHERKRKSQLIKLFNRTPEQVSTCSCKNDMA